MTVKTIQAKSVARRTGVGFGGTEAQPRPLVHATFYKREGVIVVAMVKGGIIELAPTDRVRVSTDHEADQWANLRMCRQCPTPHPRYVTAGKTGACYCADSVRSSAATYRAAKKTGKTPEQRAAERAEARRQDVAAKSDRLATAKPKSREHLIRVQLRNTATMFGLDSTRFGVVAQQYRLSIEEAHTLVGAGFIADLQADQLATA